MKNQKKYHEEIENLEKIKEIKEKINPILNFIPNIALDDVPVGKDEKSNKELKMLEIFLNLILKLNHTMKLVLI